MTGTNRDVYEQICRLGTEPTIEYLPCDSQQAAWELESEKITEIGRLDLGTGPLRNQSQGGPGAGSGNSNKRGVPDSDETRSRKSSALMGNQNLLGHRHTEESRRKISEAAKRKHEERRRDKM